MDSLVAQLIALKAVILAGWFVLLFAAERLAPAAVAAPPARGWRRVARNGALFLLNAGLSPLVVLPVSVFAATHALDWRPAWWAGAPGLLLDLVILDLWIYVWHRVNHRVPLLWRFHEVHHLDRHLDTTTAVRFHFGEVLLSAGARGVVIVLLGMPIASVLVFELVVLLSSLFQHSNLRLPGWLERPLSRVIVTPSHHWVHHHAVRADTDSNFANTLSVWDRLFGTRSPTARWATMPIGTEGREERGLTGLLLRPLDPP